MKIHTKTCPRCGDSTELRVTPQEYENWKSGMLIQKAFPNMRAIDRERLISGYCGPCWDALFLPEDDGPIEDDWEEEEEEEEE